MKRFMLLLPLAALSSLALAQTSQPDSADSTMRVQTTLKAATAKETLPGMGEPEAEPAETTPPEMDSSEPSAPETRSSQTNQPEANPAQTGQPEMNDSDSIDSGTESLPRSCANLRAEIDQKIRDNDVPRFTLEVVPTAEAESITAMSEDRQNGAEVVGSCDAGSYKIVYRRG